MTLTADTTLRRFPATPAAPARAGSQTITDLTARPRIGLRGSGAPNWCLANGLPFPDEVNGVARQDGLRIARLGTFELLVLPSSNSPLPAGLSDLPAGTYSGYRDETWAWFRFEGPGTVEALSSCTAADLRDRPDLPADRVVQTRFAGLDAVMVLGGAGDAVVAELFADIASHGYLLDVFAERCPEFRLSEGSELTVT